MTRINLSWREQRKAVIAVNGNGVFEFPSVWQAALWVCEQKDCKHSTAKKEIRKALATSCPRYGTEWKWKL